MDMFTVWDTPDITLPTITPDPRTYMQLYEQTIIWFIYLSHI